MRIQPHQAVTLLDGARVPEGYRGRLSRVGNKITNRWGAVVFGGLLLGITTAATAVTVKHISQISGPGVVGESLPANLFRFPTLGGFEETIY